MIKAEAHFQEASSNFMWRDATLILLAPLVAWWLLDIQMFIQSRYADPWYYTGAGQEFSALVQTYGWQYYYVRFPVMFVNTLFCQGATTDTGYLLLRYLIVCGSGSALYCMALHNFGRLPAVAGYCFLFCHPAYPSVINWDLTSFLSVPAALSGAALWLIDGKQRALRMTAAGALFCVSLNSHIFTAVAIGSFVAAIVTARLLWRSPARKWLWDFVWAAAGFAAIWLLGWIYYRSLFGAVDFLLFWNVNWRTMHEVSDYGVTHARPFSTWWATQTYVYVPYLLLAASLCLVRFRLLTVEKTIVLLAGVFLGVFYLIYRGVLHRFVFEEPVYFGHVWAIFPLLVPFVVARIAAGEKTKTWPALILACALIPVGAVVMENRGRIAGIMHWEGNHAAIATWLIVGLLGVLAVSVLGRWRIMRLVGFAALLSSIQVNGLVTGIGRRMYAYPDEEHQRLLYLTATEYTRFWGKYARMGERPLLWFANSSSDLDINGIGFTTLGNTLHDVWSPGGMPMFGEFERTRLVAKGTRCLFLMGKTKAELAAGADQLCAAGLEYEPVESTQIGSNALIVYIEVVRLKELPRILSELENHDG